MRVLVTGHNGYLGTVLTPMLAEHGFDTIGLDCNWYQDCSFGPEPPNVPHVAKDYRDLEVHDLKEFDAVIHLASLAIDPHGVLDAELTYDINHKASVRLAVLAKQAGVRRFVFPSTCAISPKRRSSSR